MFWLSAQIDSNVFGGSQPSVQDIRQEDEVCLFFFENPNFAQSYIFQLL